MQSDCKLLRMLLAPLDRKRLQWILFKVGHGFFSTCLEPRGAKEEQIQSIIDSIKRDDTDMMYRGVVSSLTKRDIDSVLPRKGKTKASSIDMLLALDHPRKDDTVFAIVPFDSNRLHLRMTMMTPQVDTNATLVPFVQEKKRKRIGKLWAKLAKLTHRSRQMQGHMKDILSGEGAGNLRIAAVHAELIKRLGIDFGADKYRNMYLFFHRTLRRLALQLAEDARKKAKKRKKAKRKKAPVLMFTANADAESEWRERQRMFDKDESPLRYLFASMVP